MQIIKELRERRGVSAEKKEVRENRGGRWLYDLVIRSKVYQQIIAKAREK